MAEEINVERAIGLLADHPDVRAGGIRRQRRTGNRPQPTGGTDRDGQGGTDKSGHRRQHDRVLDADEVEGNDDHAT